MKFHHGYCFLYVLYLSHYLQLLSLPVAISLKFVNVDSHIFWFITTLYYLLDLFLFSIFLSTGYVLFFFSFCFVIIIIINDLQVRRHIHASMNRSYLFYIFTNNLFKLHPTPWASPNTPFVRLFLFDFILLAGFILPFSINQNSLLIGEIFGDLDELTF